MSRYVTVSAFGSSPVETKAYGQDAIDIITEFWDEQIAKVLPDKPDLIILPESCDQLPALSGDEIKDFYRFRGDKIKDHFAKIAKDNNCYIAYSAIRALADGTFRNSTQLIDRQGNVPFIYNKNHPVICETEEGGILGGKEALVFETDFGKIACAICFDLNFRELLEKYSAQGPDLIIFSSMYHGGLMQNYWAYNCQAHFVGSCVGLECAVINPVGVKIAASTNYFHRVTQTINLDCKVVHLDGHWEKLQAAKNKYGRNVTILDPGNLGSVLLSSEMENISAGDIVREFEIEPWSEYYARSLEFHHMPGNMEQ